MANVVDATPDSMEDLMTTEIESLLSDASFEFASDEEESEASSLAGGGGGETWEQKWSSLQESFYTRDRQLRSLSRRKNNVMMNVLLRREKLVRKRETELLFMQHFQTEQHGGCDDESSDSSSSRSIHSNTSAEEEETWHDARGSPDPVSFDPSAVQTNTQEEGLLRQLFDSTLMECYITLACIFSLTLNCLFHSSLYDVIEISAEELRKFLARQIHWIRAETLLSCFTFVLGLFMMRSSGYLFWWLNGVDFSCIKFDYHNRLRLKHFDARFLLWVKHHAVLRAVFFTTGYHLCYRVIYKLYDNFYNIFFGFGEDTKTPATRLHSYWRRLMEEANSSDDAASSMTLSLATGTFCATTCVASIMLLRFYGFSVFVKY